MKRSWIGLALALAVVGGAGAEESWTPFAETDVVHVVTRDEDGAERDTKVWLVVADAFAYVRTNDSRWLANIRRGSPVALRVDAVERAVTAEEVADPAVCAAVEAAFKAKYGFMQRVMSAFRLREPTVLRLAPKAP
jgi:hypothetical protein